MRLGRVRAALAVVSVVALIAQPSFAQEGRLIVELNKLEESDGGACRAYFLFRNGTGRSLAAFEMALAVLDRDGVIDQLLTIDAAPVPVGRTTLKLFEIPGLACAAVSELLLHDIPACRPQNGEPMDCFPLIDLGSRAPARLVQ